MTTEEGQETRWTPVRAITSFLFVTCVACAVLSCAGDRANRPPVEVDPARPTSARDEPLRMDWLNLHKYGGDDSSWHRYVEQRYLRYKLSEDK